MSNDQNNQQQGDDENQLNIELSEEMAEGTYSNLAVITHSDSEFIFDFVRIMPGIPKGKVKARVFMTPKHAKKLYKALEDNLRKHESAHGKIEDEGGFEGLPMNFGGPTPEA